MLDDHEHAGLRSFEATEAKTLEDGAKVSSGLWKESHCDDPRHFVIVVSSEDKLLVDWGTEKVDESLDKREWPRVYLERNAIHELSFKDLIDHGGLDIVNAQNKARSPTPRANTPRLLIKPRLWTQPFSGPIAICASRRS